MNMRSSALEEVRHYHAGVMGIGCSSYWRASEASETLSGLFNRESRIYIHIVRANFSTCKFCSYNP